MELEMKAAWLLSLSSVGTPLPEASCGPGLGRSALQKGASPRPLPGCQTEGKAREGRRGPLGEAWNR